MNDAEGDDTPTDFLSIGDRPFHRIFVLNDSEYFIADPTRPCVDPKKLP